MGPLPTVEQVRAVGAGVVPSTRRFAMGEISERTRVVAIHRAGSAERELEYPPRRGTRSAAADPAYLVGSEEELIDVLRRDGPAVPSEP